MYIHNRWYFGAIKSSDAEEQLMQTFNDYGSFLVHDSEITLGEYSLSI